MDINTGLEFIAAKEIIKKAFSVFFTERYQDAKEFLYKTKITTIGRDNFAEYVITKVGVYPLFATSFYTSIEDAYVSINISAEMEREVYKSEETIKVFLTEQKRGIDYRIKKLDKNVTPLEALEMYDNGFALAGNAGTGKTTIFKYLTLEAAKGTKIRGKRRLPFYLPIREMDLKSYSIKDECIDLLQKLNIKEAKNVFEKLLGDNACIILLDGLDETSAENQKKILLELADLYSKYNKNIYCISARLSTLAIGLANFTKWETQPLEIKDKMNFIQKWYKIVDQNKGKQLLEKAENNPEILDLGTNPLLLAIICALYNNDLEIPIRAEELYERVLHGLLGGWDAFRNIIRKTPFTGLTPTQRIVMLSMIAKIMFENDKIVFKPSDLVRYDCIKQINERLPVINLDAYDLLNSLTNDFGIIIERAPNTYSFSHLSIQEYLTAKYYVDNREETKIINENFNNRKWEDIILNILKLLPSAEDCIEKIHKIINYENLNQLMLLEKIWRSKPICNVNLKKIMMKQIATKLAGKTERYLSYRSERETLILYAPFSEYDEEVIKNKKVYQYYYNNFTDCIPYLIRIIEINGITIEELGLKNSKFFSYLEKCETKSFNNAIVLKK